MTRKDNVEKVRERARKILDSGTGDPQELADLGHKLDILDEKWNKLENGIEKRVRKIKEGKRHLSNIYLLKETHLTKALAKAVDLSEMMWVKLCFD